MSAAEQIRASIGLDTRAGYAVDRLTAMQYALAKGDYVAALRTADSFAAIFGELIAGTAQAAYDAGESKASIARILGVSPATFRGMERS